MDSLTAVGKPSRIGRSFASDSATNLHFYNGILRRGRPKLRKSAESGVIGYRLAIAVGPGVTGARLLSFPAAPLAISGNRDAVYFVRTGG
jgi:hypothetical protein